jgi:hypothetical protein
MIYLINPSQHYKDDLFADKYATNPEEIAQLAAYYWVDYLCFNVANIEVNMEKMEVTACDTDDEDWTFTLYIVAIPPINNS